VTIFPAAQGGDCRCGVGQEATIEKAEIDGIVRYRAMRRMGDLGDATDRTDCGRHGGRRAGSGIAEILDILEQRHVQGRREAGARSSVEGHLAKALTARHAIAHQGIRDAAVSFDVTVARRGQARRGIEAIDMVLEEVEQHHLAQRPRRIPPLPEWIAWLEQEGGLSVPARILGLKDTVRLHGALLDWQDELLSTALPGRAQLVRSEEEDDVE
jgi:hypothetical protein